MQSRPNKLVLNIRSRVFEYLEIEEGKKSGTMFLEIAGSSKVKNLGPFYLIRETT
jgi:hypothetical protein